MLSKLKKLLRNKPITMMLLAILTVTACVLFLPFDMDTKLMVFCVGTLSILAAYILYMLIDIIILEWK